MRDKIYNVMFLCTGNSARSVMAECALNRRGAGKFRAFSAGSRPAGQVHPCTLDLLKKMNYRTEGLRSKSWDEFSAPGAPEMDFVFSVCDNAAGETCPVWPGHPMTAHWPFPDPVAFDGPEVERRAVFAQVYGMIGRRIATFVSLPVASLDRLALKRRLHDLGRRAPENA
jgi:protein-tyrosine-phosphatase